MGIEKRCHPDWFRESADTIKPAIQHRNKMHTKWLSTKHTEDHVKFKRAHGDARQGIRKAKNDWFETKAEETQREQFGGKKVWKCI